MQSQLEPNQQELVSYNGAPPHSVPGSMTADFTQRAISYNNTQPNQTPVLPIQPGLGNRNDMFRDVIPGYEFNYSMAGSWEAPAPQPLGHGGYMMPSVQYGNDVERGRTARTNYGSQYDFTANQFSDPTVPFPYLPSGAYTAPNNPEAFPVWCLYDVWVSDYAVQDELYVTIAFRRIRSA